MFKTFSSVEKIKYSGNSFYRFAVCNKKADQNKTYNGAGRFLKQ